MLVTCDPHLSLVPCLLQSQWLHNGLLSSTNHCATRHRCLAIQGKKCKSTSHQREPEGRWERSMLGWCYGMFLTAFYNMIYDVYIYVTYPQLWGSSDTHRYIQSNGCMKLIWVELDNAILLVVLNTSSFTEIHQFQTNSYALQPSCGWVFFLWLRSTECHTLNLWYSIPASRWCNEETWDVWNWKQQRNWHMIPGTSLTVMQSWVQNNIWFDYCYP